MHRGRMLLSQNPFAPREPREARAAGIGMVFQHFSLFEALSVAENIALGMDLVQLKMRNDLFKTHFPSSALSSLRAASRCEERFATDW